MSIHFIKSTHPSLSLFSLRDEAIENLLVEAAQKGEVTNLKELLKRDDITSAMLDKALDNALITNNAIIELLLAGAGTTQKITPTSNAVDSKLRDAVWKENHPLALFLLEKGSHTPQGLNEALIAAVRKADAQMVEHILTHSTTPTTDGIRIARDRALFFSKKTDLDALDAYQTSCNIIAERLNYFLEPTERTNRLTPREFRSSEAAKTD